MNYSPDKIPITEKIVCDVFDKYDLNGDLDKVIKSLKKLQKSAKDSGYINVRMEVSAGEEYGDVVWDLELWGKRLETDAEYQARLAAIEAELIAKEQETLLKEAAERQEYERLKQKFES